jgi:hypothetical protein
MPANAEKQSEAARFLSDPVGFFDGSRTAMHSPGREELGELQRVALSTRFRQQVSYVPMLAKLAGRQGITEITGLEAAVPLLFEYTMYKSYPVALLERQQVGLLPGWLGKLTSADLTGLDLSGCDSIDAWLDLLASGTELDVTFTSGTSGTMSFLLWSKRDHAVGWQVNRVNALQRLGEPARAEVAGAPYQYLIRHNRLRGSYRADVYTLGEPGLAHTGLSRLSADLMWMGARLRFAATRGRSEYVQVLASLLARRGELVAPQKTQDAAIKAWLDGLGNFEGKLVIWNTFPHDVLPAAAGRLAKGVRWSFAPGSVLSVTGGTKGHALAADWKETVARFTDARIAQAYGMSELSTLKYMCGSGRYHLNPWVVPYVLDPETSRVLSREGAQTGRLGFLDLLTESHWGGLLTGTRSRLTSTAGATAGRPLSTWSMMSPASATSAAGTTRSRARPHPRHTTRPWRSCPAISDGPARRAAMGRPAVAAVSSTKEARCPRRCPELLPGAIRRSGSRLNTTCAHPASAPTRPRCTPPASSNARRPTAGGSRGCSLPSTTARMTATARRPCRSPRRWRPARSRFG